MERVRPDIVVPVYAVRAPKEIEAVIVGDDGVVCSRRWYLAVWWSAVNGILDENLPAVRCLLESIEVESDEIIEEVALDLTAEDVDLAAENVQGMTVPSWWSGSCGECSRPLLRCCGSQFTVSVSGGREADLHVLSR